MSTTTESHDTSTPTEETFVDYYLSSSGEKANISSLIDLPRYILKCVRHEY